MQIPFPSLPKQSPNKFKSERYLLNLNRSSENKNSKTSSPETKSYSKNFLEINQKYIGGDITQSIGKYRQSFDDTFQDSHKKVSDKVENNRYSWLNERPNLGSNQKYQKSKKTTSDIISGYSLILFSLVYMTFVLWTKIFWSKESLSDLTRIISNSGIFVLPFGVYTYFSWVGIKLFKHN